MAAYYNEHDPYAAQWLRNLIKAGQIADGEVDERSIAEVTPVELAGFAQCHFFAGIGVWSHALRRAGWSDDRPVWTGSCPCQPFSAAGKGAGFDDQRHLWPHWHHLINECRPPVVLGEQVASKDGLGWIDLVSSDLEASSYAVAAADLCAAGFGGAHIRQRLYFVGLADAAVRGRQHEPFGRSAGIQFPQYVEGEFGQQSGAHCAGVRRLADSEYDGHNRPQVDAAKQGCHREENGLPDGDGAACGMADAEGSRWREEHADGGRRHVGNDARQAVGCSGSGATDRMANAERAQEYEEQRRSEDDEGGREADGFGGCNAPGRMDKHECIGRSQGRNWNHGRHERIEPHADGEDDGNGSADAPMLGRNAADWLFCRDGKWRPVEPGTFPLAYEIAGRVGRLRAYGNGLDAETATQFVETVMELM